MVKKLHIKENTASMWDMNVAAKQCANEALKNFKQGIENFEMEVNTKLDRPSFWQTFRKEMTDNVLDFEITEKDTAWSDHYYYMNLYNLNNDLDESYNNTEEQELAEFLDWLKQEKIPVANVNRKFKMIHLQNPKDLDMASWYLHDRDYFKKLSDFGWMVGAPSSAGKKVAKALNMESKKLKEGLRYYVTDDDFIPLREQPNEGYTELQAVERAQREAERSAKLFNLRVSETAKWYHIIDSNHEIRHDLDNAI